MEKLLKNVIENPTEPKYRQIKKENAKLKEALVCYKSGQDLMIILGFKLITEEESKKLKSSEQVYRIAQSFDTSYLKGVKLDLQRSYTEILKTL